VVPGKSNLNKGAGNAVDPATADAVLANGFKTGAVKATAEEDVEVALENDMAGNLKGGAAEEAAAADDDDNEAVLIAGNLKDRAAAETAAADDANEVALENDMAGNLKDEAAAEAAEDTNEAPAAGNVKDGAAAEVAVEDGVEVVPVGGSLKDGTTKGADDVDVALVGSKVGTFAALVDGAGTLVVVVVTVGVTTFGARAGLVAAAAATGATGAEELRICLACWR
jgi:hypothetical protein